MQTNLEPQKIEQLMTEADELVEQVYSDVLEEMEEEQRLRFEIHARKLERIKAEVQDRIDRKNAANAGSGAEGIHEAILSIIEAMRGFTKSLSR